MRTRKTYLLWGIGITGAGFFISMVVTIGLMTGFMVRLVLSPVHRWIPLAMLVISVLFIVAGVVLLVVGLTRK